MQYKYEFEYNTVLYLYLVLFFSHSETSALLNFINIYEELGKLQIPVMNVCM